MANVFIVCGSRRWAFDQMIEDLLGKIEKKHGPAQYLITGGATGADDIAHEEGKRLGFITIRMEANWDYDRRSAGPVRNGRMLKVANLLREGSYNDVHVYGFRIPGSSPGTDNMIKQASLDFGFSTKVFAPGDDIVLL